MPGVEMGEKKIDSISVSLKYFRTVCLCLGFLTLGLCVAVIGPVLPTLAYNLQVHISKLSSILLSRAAGYLIGSITSGLIYEKFDPHLMIFVALSITAIGTIIIPFLDYVSITAIAISTVGISMGFLDTAGNVMCLQTWGDKSGPYMQTLHFSFALGTTIVPLVAIPFIMDVEHNDNANTTATYNINITDNDNANTTVVASTMLTTSFVAFEKFYGVTYIFIICAVVTVLVGLSFLYLYCFHRHSSVSDQENTVQKEGSAFRIKMLVLLFCFFLIYVGAEVSFGVYIYTFATTCEKQYSKTIASLMNSVFWGAFAVGRFIAIPISRFFPPSRVLQADLLGTLVSAITLVCFPFYAKSADFLLWLAIAVYGISMASIFPTGITWAEQYITITGKAAMILVVGAATGEMLFPFLAGQFVEANPMYMMYFALGSVCASFLLYILLVLLARTKGKRLKKATSIETDDDETKESLTQLKLESKNI